MRTGFNISPPLLDLLAFVLLEGRLCEIRVSISPEMRSKSEKKPPSAFSHGDESYGRSEKDAAHKPWIVPAHHVSLLSAMDSQGDLAMIEDPQEAVQLF